MGFTDLEDFNSSQFTILNWTISSLAISVTILRLIVRIDHHKRLYWDDFLNVFGLTCLVIMAILNQFQRDIIFLIIDEQDNGTEGLVTPEATARQAKLQFVFLTLFWTCLWTIKLSFLMFYQRLFINVQGYMKWWWGVMAFCIVTWVACIMFNFLECSPLSRRFAMDIQDACAANTNVGFVTFTTCMDIFTDVAVMVLPIKLLMGLRISKKNKIGVGIIFTIGHLIIIFSIIRVVEITESLGEANKNVNVSLSMWSILEASVAVIVGSLPALKSLISKKGDSYYSSGPTGNTYGTGSRNATGGPTTIPKSSPAIRLHDFDLACIQNNGYDSGDALHQIDGSTLSKGSTVGTSPSDTIVPLPPRTDLDAHEEGSSIESFRHA